MPDAINIEEQRQRLTSKAEELFNAVNAIPAETRGDTKQRTGITVLVRQIQTRNMIQFGIHFPSEATKFFVVEKAVRSELFREATSGHSANDDALRFEGSITFTTNDGIAYQVSTSGMLAPEDTGISVALMAEFLQIEVSEVIANITHHEHGILPDYFSDKGHYMQPIIGY